MPYPDYVPTDWQQNITLVDESRMDHIEAGLDAASENIQDLDSRVLAEEGQPDIPAVVNGQWLKGSGGALIFAPLAVSDVTGLQAALDAKEDDANKGAASGYAPLDSGSKIPVANMPPYVAGLTYKGAWSGATAYVEGDVVVHNGRSYVALEGSTNEAPVGWSDLASVYQARSEEGVANGYASLGADVKVPATQLRLAPSDLDVAPTCILTHSGNYTLPNGLNTLNLDTEVVDTHAMHAAAASAIVLTPGYWIVWIVGRMPAAGGGTARELILEIAGTRVIDIVYPVFAQGAHDWTHAVVYRCPSGTQSMSLQSYQDTGGNVTGSRLGFGCRYLGKL